MFLARLNSAKNAAASRLAVDGQDNGPTRGMQLLEDGAGVPLQFGDGTDVLGDAQCHVWPHTECVYRALFDCK